jgi:glycosyltransferase involved in cell wall biosynthesis
VKLGLVVPRYGQEVIGGTEQWLRTLLEHLVSLRGWKAEVFTTCATSAATWEDVLAPGDTVENGVLVHRHRSVSVRDGRYLEMYPRLRADPSSVSAEDERKFVELVGPVCPAVIDHADGSDCDLIAVTPYLYWPAVEAVRRMGRRVIFHGAAHDEAELYLPLMREVFTAVGGFSFNTFAERALVEGIFPVAHLPACVVGNAVVEGTGDPEAARAAIGLRLGEQFVLCVGRVERSKGSHALAEMWDLYCSRHPGAPRLVYVGTVHDPLETRPSALVTGPQPEAVKWGLLDGCQAVMLPSAWESFSVPVIEAGLSRKPVVVNGRCGPTVEHCRRSGGGLWFDDYGDFEAAVDRLLCDGELREQMGARGERYARGQFSWAVVTERYERLAGRILEALKSSSTRN